MKHTMVLLCILHATMLAIAQQRPNLDILTKESNPAVLQQKIKTLGEGNEQDKALLIDYYDLIKDARKADSVFQAVLKEYPLGRYAYIQAMNKVTTEPDVAKKEQLVAKVLQTFPNADRSRLHHNLAYGYANARNIPKALENVNAITDPKAKFMATLVVVRIIINYDLPAAESLIRPQIDDIVKAGVPEPPPKEGDTGPRGDARPAYFLFLELYTKILVKMEKYEEALKYAQDVYTESNGKKDEVTEYYGLALSKTNHHQEAVPLLEKLIALGKGSAEVKAAFKESYSKVNPDKDASVYLSSLENGMKKEIEAEVRKLLISKEAPNFILKDVNGKSVSLADFKGKTIVLDFWATWCMPCISSFPAMQMAVNKYKNDPKVKFLFIHTWERVEDPLTDAKKFLSDNHYNFDLYIDGRDQKTKNNPAVTAFGPRGIPAKFIIDGNGKIRFQITGFAGGNEAAVAELSAMIEISKKGV